MDIKKLKVLALHDRDSKEKKEKIDEIERLTFSTGRWLIDNGFYIKRPLTYVYDDMYKQFVNHVKKNSVAYLRSSGRSLDEFYYRFSRDPFDITFVEYKNGLYKFQVRNE